MPPLLPTLDYLSPAHVARAVFGVYRANELAGDPPANSDVWTMSSEHRLAIWERTRREWCRATGLGVEWFHLNEDATARLYLRLRKRSTVELSAWETELEGA